VDAVQAVRNGNELDPFLFTESFSVAHCFSEKSTLLVDHHHTRLLIQDFAALAEATYRTGKPPAGASLEALFGVLSRLEKWHLAVAADQRETRFPFQSSKDEKKCVFIFTDTDYARQFAKENELADVSGESVLMSMTASNAVKWIEEQSTANGLSISA